MAEVTIGGIGLLGLLTLFQTCNRAYDIFIRSARNLGKDAHRLGVNLEVERQKLRLWGRYLGISSAGQCRLLCAESFETQKMAVTFLDALRTTLDDIDTIMARYGVQIVEGSEDPEGSSTSNKVEAINLQDIRVCDAVKTAGIKREATERSIVASASRLGKIRWALNDNRKLEKLVEDVRKINEDLWVLLPVNQWLALAKGLPSVVLPAIQDQTMLLEVAGNARGNARTQLLASCSELRSFALTSVANESAPGFGMDICVKVNSLVRGFLLNTGDPKVSNEAQRELASFLKEGGEFHQEVIIEWRYVESYLNYQEKEAMRSRIRSLAVLLNSRKTPDFGLLKCVGIYEDNEHHVERYGLLFEIEQRQRPTPGLALPLQDPTHLRPRSLYECISWKNTPPLLGDRFYIASALCNTLLQLHAASWLHKAIRSSNVILFPKDKSPNTESAQNFDLTRPFLMGFDYSRPDRKTTDSLDVPSNRTFNDYRHPALWTQPIKNLRYSKHFDIYSLGVVLLEIGVWKLVSSIEQKYRDPEHPEKWAGQLSKWVNALGHRCGKIYQEVVATCLTGTFTEEDIGVDVFGPPDVEQGVKCSFLFDIVYKLGNCCA